MSRYARWIAPLAAIGIVIAILLPGGGDIEKATASATPCGEVNIAVNNWVGYEADAFVVGEVAQKELGCLVNYVYVDEQISWQGFASGQVDAVLENWGHPELIDLYVKKLKVAEDAGSIGITGVIGWYVPPWMKKKYPDITDWKNLNKTPRCSRPASRGQGPAARRRPRVRHQRRGPGEEPEAQLQGGLRRQRGGAHPGLPAGEEQKKPVIGYFYSPQWFLAEVPLVKVDLPKYTTGCDAKPAEVACDYPPYPLHKIVSKQFAADNSTGYQLIKNFTWSDKDQNLVAKYITADGMLPEKAADKWIKDNPDKVKAWLSGISH